MSVVVGSGDAVVKSYLSDWGRMVRSDRNIKSWGSTPLGSLQPSTTKVFVEDVVMNRIFSAMQLVRQVDADAYGVAWQVYVKRRRVKDHKDWSVLSRTKITELLSIVVRLLKFYLLDHAQLETPNDVAVDSSQAMLR